MARLLYFCMTVALALQLTACQRTPAAAPAPDVAARQRAALAQPADPALAAVYQRSCQTCHAQVASQAPLVGFAPHWETRRSQGMPTLLAHVRQGLGAMPPLGFCADCNDATFTDLIAFLSTPLPAAAPPP